MLVSIKSAKANLSKLIEAAQAGDDVVITRYGKPVIRLVAVPETTKFKFGALKGKVTGPMPDFFEPMSEDDLKLWEGGDAEPEH